MTRGAGARGRGNTLRLAPFAPLLLVAVLATVLLTQQVLAARQRAVTIGEVALQSQRAHVSQLADFPGKRTARKQLNGKGVTVTRAF
jgi:hypothetical protein